MPDPIRAVDIVVIGAGAPGLTAAYSLRALGLVPLRDFIVLDAQPGPGATWRNGWEFMTVARALDVGTLSDLPGQEDLGIAFRPTPALVRDVAPELWRRYEDAYELFVMRPAVVTRVDPIRWNEDLLVTARFGRGKRTRERTFRTRLILNATGSWSSPFVPWYPGMDRFEGKMAHAYRLPPLGDFTGQRVLVVGGGRSAVHLLLELERRGIETVWSTRRDPDFHMRPTFALARSGKPTVGEFAGLPRARRLAERGKRLPSDVSLRGLPLTPMVFDAIRRGTLHSQGPLISFGTHSAVLAGGRSVRIDAVLWATGGRESVRHLAPLGLREEGGTPKIRAGWSRRDPRIAFLGYGPGAAPADALLDAMSIGEVAIDRLVG